MEHTLFLSQGEKYLKRNIKKESEPRLKLYNSLSKCPTEGQLAKTRSSHHCCSFFWPCPCRWLVEISRPHHSQILNLLHYEGTPHSYLLRDPWAWGWSYYLFPTPFALSSLFFSSWTIHPWWVNCSQWSCLRCIFTCFLVSFLCI